MFKGWDIFIAESPVLPETHPLYFTSPWTASCNVLLLDERRVVCEASEEPTIRAFESWGFDVVKVKIVGWRAPGVFIKTDLFSTFGSVGCILPSMLGGRQVLDNNQCFYGRGWM